MKKTYISPKMRVVQLGCSDGIAENELPMVNSNATGMQSRRDRFSNDWDEENW